MTLPKALCQTGKPRLREAFPDCRWILIYCTQSRFNKTLLGWAPACSCPHPSFLQLTEGTRGSPPMGGIFSSSQDQALLTVLSSCCQNPNPHPGALLKGGDTCPHPRRVSQNLLAPMGDISHSLIFRTGRQALGRPSCRRRLREEPGGSADTWL